MLEQQSGYRAAPLYPTPRSGNAVSHWTALAPVDYEVAANPAIGDKGTVRIRLPEGVGAGPFPFLVGIHGGGWENGDRLSYDWCWERLQGRGVALVTGSHRKQSDAPWPAQYDDYVTMLRWLKSNAAEHKLDSGKCGLYGCSSGGHLTALLATRATKEEGDSIPTIRAAVPYAGVMDMAKFAEESRITASLFRGVSPQEDPAMYTGASPTANLHSRVPPMLLIHGDGDDLVPVAQSRAMAAAMAGAGLQHRLLEVQGGVHFGMNGPDPGGDAAYATAADGSGQKCFICEEEVLAFLAQAGLAPATTSTTSHEGRRA